MGEAISTIGAVLEAHAAMKADRDTARASEARLREALEPFMRWAAQLDAAPNWVPDGCPILASPGDISDFNVGQLRAVRAALSATSGEWLERQLSEAVAAERERAEKAEATWRCFHCGFKTDDAKVAEAHFGDVDEEEPICRSWERMNADEKVGAFQGALQEIASEQEENSQLRSKLEKAEAERDTWQWATGAKDKQLNKLVEHLSTVEAERDGLAVKFDYMAGEFQRHVDYVAQKYNEETGDVRATFGNVTVDLARITAEARRKALVEVYERVKNLRGCNAYDVIDSIEEMAKETTNG